MEGHVWAAAIVIALLASACQSLTGFGFALVFVPLLSLFWDVKAAVVTCIMLGPVLTLPLLATSWRLASGRRVLVLLLGSAAGLPLGLYLLQVASAEVLGLLVGSLVIVFCLAIYRGARIPSERGDGVLAPLVGMVSGALRAATSMGGPPVVLYLLGRDCEAPVFRATALAYFAPLSIMSIAGVAAVGQVDGDVLVASAAVLPALAVGMALGQWLRPRVRESAFQLISLSILLGAGVSMVIVSSLRLA